MVTTDEFLQFWAKAIPSLQVHPDDVYALNGNRHTFELDALVGPWMGPLRTAPVVILTTNGKTNPNGVERYEATIPSAREEMARNLQGHAPLPSFATNPGGRKWTAEKLAQFDNLSYEDAAPKVAFVNLMPYRSRDGRDKHMVKLLPSCRLLKAWARDTLFREAEAGKCVVVCLRAARDWGLMRGTQRGQSLFAPKTTPSAFMYYTEMCDMEMRNRVVIAVRRALGRQ
jgi:hypothetical protein